MRLPEIDYGGSVQGTAQTAALPYEAAAGVTKVIGEGLREYSKALIQAQQTNAAVKVSENLNQAANVLKAKKFVTEQELRDTMGGELPPALAERIKVLPKDQIPMWAVGDTLFAHQATKVVEEAAKGIDGTGWQTDFKDRIAASVADRRQGLAVYHLEGLDRYLQTDAKQAVERLINAGDFGAAREAAFSTALPAEEQVRQAALVETAKQEHGARLAMTSESPGFIREQITRLSSDPAAAKSIPAERRAGFIHALEDRWTKFEGARLAGEAFDKGVTPGTWTLNEGAIFSAVDASTKGASPTLRKEARDLAKARIADFVESRKANTSNVFAGALQEFDAPGPLQFRVASISPGYRAYLTNPANGREAAELWQALLDKERSYETHGRTLAAMPTEEHYKAYAEVVKDMEDNPSKYRKMPAEQFVASVYGKVGPLIDKAMVAYKGAVEAPPMDKRVVLGSERQAALEALPPQYRPSSTTKPDSTQGKVWAYIQDRVADRKEAEWDEKKGPVPQGKIKEWVAEEWAKGTVKGGQLWGLMDKKDVPKAVAPVAYPGKEWVPDQSAPAAPSAPAAAPASVTKAKPPPVGTRVPGEALGRSGGTYERVEGGWKKVAP